MPSNRGGVVHNGLVHNKHRNDEWRAEIWSRKKHSIFDSKFKSIESLCDLLFVFLYILNRFCFASSLCVQCRNKRGKKGVNGCFLFNFLTDKMLTMGLFFTLPDISTKKMFRNEFSISLQPIWRELLKSFSQIELIHLWNWKSCEKCFDSHCQCWPNVCGSKRWNLKYFLNEFRILIGFGHFCKWNKKKSFIRRDSNIEIGNIPCAESTYILLLNVHA